MSRAKSQDLFAFGGTTDPPTRDARRLTCCATAATVAAATRSTSIE
jgi:hypothetical protein